MERIEKINEQIKALREERHILVMKEEPMTSEDWYRLGVIDTEIKYLTNSI